MEITEVKSSIIHGRIKLKVTKTFNQLDAFSKFQLSDPLIKNI